LKVGVLALQGDVREHLSLFRGLGVNAVEIRTPSDLQEVQGLVLPGGESTTISKLLDIFDMRRAILEFGNQGGAMFGTCAGMIMLAKDVLDAASNQQSLGLIDVSVRRNAFGSQLDSFEQELTFSGEIAKVAFIRAPIVERVGNGVQVLSTLDDGRVVAVRQNKVLACSFHPEITGETLVHKYFLSMLDSE
jgi:pyridoxal 5'-phosphate synthase pdxT subunit